MGLRSAVLVHGLRPRANTADLVPVTGPIRNYLINNIIILSQIRGHNRSSLADNWFDVERRTF